MDVRITLFSCGLLFARRHLKLEAERQLQEERKRQQELRDRKHMKKQEKLERAKQKAAEVLLRKQGKLMKKLATLQAGGLLAPTSSGTSSPQDGAAPKSVCYLCRKKFKSQALLQRHVAESKLHMENLAKKQQAGK